MIWSDWKGRMEGQDCVVLGDGPSTAALAAPGCDWTRSYYRIACNRAVRVVVPDFAVCVEPPRRDRELWREMQDLGRPVFTKQEMAAKWWDDVVLIENDLPRSEQRSTDDFRTWVGPEPRKFGGEHLKCQMSPAWAVGVAAHLGFRNVALVGVDLTGDRWGDLSRWEARWAELIELCAAVGTSAFNASEISRLRAAPLLDPIEILRVRGS